MNLAGVDLNLLVALDALLEERNVTRAASRVGLSQPAMSNALSRLRALFDDPLLVRASRGMVPTPRALELAEPIRTALSHIDTAINASPSFDPKTAVRTFKILIDDSIVFESLPRLLRQFEIDAPNIDLRTVRGVEQVEVGLASGELDLAVSIAGLAFPGTRAQTLPEEKFVCLSRLDHPRIGKRLTLKKFVAAGHVLVTPVGTSSRGQVDAALAARDLERRIVVTTPHFMLAPMIVAESDLITTLGERIAKKFARLLGLRVHKPPIEIASFERAMYWHQRTDSDPSQRWLREQVAAALMHSPPE